MVTRYKDPPSSFRNKPGERITRQAVEREAAKEGARGESSRKALPELRAKEQASNQRAAAANQRKRDAVRIKETAQRVPNKAGPGLSSFQDIASIDTVKNSTFMQELGQQQSQSVSQGLSSVNPDVLPKPPAPTKTPMQSYDGTVSHIAETGKFQHSFFTPEGQKERFKNVLDVYKEGIGFGEVKANTGSPLMNKMLETVAEHPFSTAALATGVWQTYQAAMTAYAGLSAAGAAVEAGTVGTLGAAGRAAGGNAVQTTLTGGATTATGIGVNSAVNSANAATQSSHLISAVRAGISNMKNYRFVLGALSATATWALSGSFSENEYGDAVMALQIAQQNAYKSGDKETGDEIYEMMQEIKPQKLDWYWGPIAYVRNVGIKQESLFEISEKQKANSDQEFTQAVQDQQLADRIRADLATPEEEAQYAKDHPFSDIAANYKIKQKNLDSQGNSIFGSINEQGKYVPSNTEIAKKEWEDEVKNVDATGSSLYGHVNENGVYIPSRTELAKRLEAQQYYDSIQGGGGGEFEERQFEPPSSLNFGLLRTSGGYEKVDKDTALQSGQELVSDTDEIARAIFTVPYSQLSDIQRQVVDGMVP